MTKSKHAHKAKSAQPPRQSAQWKRDEAKARKQYALAMIAFKAARTVTEEAARKANDALAKWIGLHSASAAAILRGEAP